MGDEMRKVILTTLILMLIGGNVFSYPRATPIKVSPYLKYSGYALSGVLIWGGLSMFTNSFGENGSYGQAYIGTFTVMLGIHFAVTVYEW